MDDLATALDTVLRHKADRFINNPGYLVHVQKCVEVLELTDPNQRFSSEDWMLCSRTLDRPNK